MAAAWRSAEEGEAAAVTAAIRLESLAKGSFSADRPAALLHERQPSIFLSYTVRLLGHT